MTADTTLLQHKIIRLSELPSEQIMLEPSLIKDLLRRRQKLAISAPKVSLKTSLAIHLAVSVAYGLNWLGWQCNSSKILYINLNISKQECIVRFNKAIEHLQLDRTSVSNIDILNIEVAQGISNLVDDIIQAMNTQHYRAVVIDSLDNIPAPTCQKENRLVELNRLTSETNSCVIFTESHSHRPIGNDEARAMADWSDILNYCDSLIELIPLELDPELLRRERLLAVWEFSKNILNTHNKRYYLMNVTDKYPERADSNSEQLFEHLETALISFPEETKIGIFDKFHALDNPIKNRTYWRLETVSNSFPPKEATNNLFYYPILKHDDTKILEFHEPGLKISDERIRSSIEEENEREVFTAKLTDGIHGFFDKHEYYPNQKELSEYLGVSRQTIATWKKKAYNTIAIIDGRYQDIL